jgi:hypothetical protein
MNTAPRRLEQLMNGDLDSSRGLIARLPDALNVPPEIVEASIDLSSNMRQNTQGMA